MNKSLTVTVPIPDTFAEALRSPALLERFRQELGEELMRRLEQESHELPRDASRILFANLWDLYE
jgi:hypothetical protein